MTNSKKIPTIKVTDITFSIDSANAQRITARYTGDTKKLPDADTYNSEMSQAISKAIVLYHVAKYADKTVDINLAKAVYDVTFNLFNAESTTKKIIIPLCASLTGDIATSYIFRATILQNAIARHVNGTTSDMTQKALDASRKARDTVIKESLQKVFDFYVSQRTDSLAMHANTKDIELLNSMVIRLKGESITTIGEKKVQEILEFIFRKKLVNNEYYAEMYSIVKAQDKAVTKPIIAEDGSVTFEEVK